MNNYCNKPIQKSLLIKQPSMIFYLIYLSSATKPFSDKDLSEILAVSRLNNTSKGITGLLLYNEGDILQVLEGEEESVLNLYANIEADTRHTGVVKMVSGTSKERSFPDWSMGVKTASDSEWGEMTGYLSIKPFHIFQKLKHTNEKIDRFFDVCIDSSLR